VAAQVVNGTNYFFKVKIAAFEFIHLRVHVSLFGDEPKLVAMRKGEVAAGPLEFFESGCACSCLCVSRTE